MNLTALNAGAREFSIAYCRQALELAHDLRVPTVLFLPGRIHHLIPMPETELRRHMRRALDQLVPVAEQLGVTLGIETPPPGYYLNTAAACTALAAEYRSPNVGVVIDCTNIFATEDLPDAVRATAEELVMVHVSDTWRARHAHTSVGRGEIDFQAFADALREIGFEGPSIYELVDGEDVHDRLAADQAKLASWGWSTGAEPRIRPVTAPR
jgi:sugar phosphate isomerase/epimerase